MSRAAAVATAERGWAVFPCQPGKKVPAVPDDWQGRACADPDRVARYWPSDRHNIGVACEPSRLVVLDLDAHGELPAEWRELPGVNDGKDVFAQICEWAGMDWPQTYTVATPNSGWHLYFTVSGKVPGGGNGKLGPQADVKAAGGYVVGAGSTVGGKPYEVLHDDDPAPLPQWIARLLEPKAQPAAGRAAFTPSGQPGKRLEGLLRTVAEAQPGKRNETLFWAASRAAEMNAAGEVDAREAATQLLAAAVSAGLDEPESMRTITSAMKGTR